MGESQRDKVWVRGGKRGGGFAAGGRKTATDGFRAVQKAEELDTICIDSKRHYF